MAKFEKGKQLTTMRGFAESTARKYFYRDELKTRSQVELMPYVSIARTVKKGKLWTAKEVKVKKAAVK